MSDGNTGFATGRQPATAREVADASTRSASLSVGQANAAPRILPAHAIVDRARVE